MGRNNKSNKDKLDSHKHNKAEMKQIIKKEEQLKGDTSIVYDLESYAHLPEEIQIQCFFLLENLKEYDLLSNLDVGLLIQIGTTLHHIDLCQEEIAEKGLFIKTEDKKGNEDIKPNPAVGTLEKLGKWYQNLSSMACINPKDRQNLQNASRETKAEQAKPLSLLMAQRNKNKENNNADKGDANR